jgi:hypothetical protein
MYHPVNNPRFDLEFVNEYDFRWYLIKDKTASGLTSDLSLFGIPV